MPILTKDFFVREDVVAISKELLGKHLVTRFDGVLCSGIITETEAYDGIHDRACHAYNNRRTQRTEVMYAEGGVAYVYLCYGMHHLFNVVTGKKDVPQAVLIRAIHPVDGIATQLKRRKQTTFNKHIANGPGKVTQALAIKSQHTSTNLCGDSIWIEDSGMKLNKATIHIGTRIGVDYAKEDALLPYRFWIDIPH